MNATARKTKSSEGMRLAVLTLTAGLTAACSGGGEESGPPAPPITVSFTEPSSGASEIGGAMGIDVILGSSAGPLTEEVTVQVTDAGTGTATSGGDYATFTVQTVTFPVGAMTGSSQSVTLTPLVDTLAEGVDETVRLALVNPSGAAISGFGSQTVTIEDAQTASVQFDQAVTITGDESAITYALDVELDLSAGATLGFDITLTAQDDGTGDATSGVDYIVIAPQTIQFLEGSAHGQTVIVSVQVLDDADTEGAEFLAVTLSGSGMASLEPAGPTRHILTITDDEAAPAPLFSATNGVTGTETSHSSGGTLDLGSQVNGMGPNLGTLLRIGNAGSGPMTLGQPVLAGTDDSDFALEIDSASLPLAAGMGTPPETFDISTPFLRRGSASPATAGLDADPLPGIALTLDESALAGLGGMGAVRMHGVPLPGLGEVTLQLERMDLPIARDALLMVDGEYVTGGPRTLVSDLTLWTGRAVEIPDSKVFLAVSSEGPEGRIELPFGIARTIHITTEQAPSASSPARVRIVHEADLKDFPAFDRPPLCSGSELVPGDTLDLVLPETSDFPQGGTDASGAPPTSGLVTAPNCRLALETDFQFYEKFGTSSGVTNYVTSLVAALSDQYMEDVQTTFSIAYLGIHTTAADPWTSPDAPGDTAAMLTEFRNAWNASGWPATADLAHFLSGASLGGGRAYVNVICSQTFGYGVSGNLRGNINWANWTGSAGSFTWDFVVLAHELGHNFGANHTHDYCPPIDVCFDNCAGPNTCSQGTIMSYCHSCGGMDNIDLHFHPNVANIMRGRVDSSCLGDAAMPSGDHITYRVQFAPESGAGAKSATLTFDHDAQNAADPFQLTLTGTSN